MAKGRSRKQPQWPCGDCRKACTDDCVLCQVHQSMVVMETEETDVPAFQLKHDSLGNRCNDVFGCLDQLEKKHQDFEQLRAVEDASEDSRLSQHCPSVEELASTSESVTFKKPTLSGRDYHRNNKGGRHGGHERTSPKEDFKAPSPVGPSSRGGPSRGRSRHSRDPDYTLNPGRWTEYSLEDVDISDTTNKQAAFSFLEERRAMREGDLKDESIDVNSVACSRGAITFKRPSKSKVDDKKENSVKSNKFDSNMNADDDVEMADEGDENKVFNKAEINISDNSESFSVDGNNGNKQCRTENFLIMESGSSSSKTNIPECLDVNFKRKLDISDETSIETSVSVDKPTGFKSRKLTKKRNIRTRDSSE